MDGSVVQLTLVGIYISSALEQDHLNQAIYEHGYVNTRLKFKFQIKSTS